MSAHRQLELFGKPVSKQSFNRVVTNIDFLVSNYARKIRFMQATIARLSQLEVDALSLDGLNLGSPDAAYRAYAWYRTCCPFKLSSMQHYVDIDRLEQVMCKHPDYLYRYGLFFVAGPDEGVLDRLSGMHGPTGRLYFEHCLLHRAAEVEGYDIKQLINW